MNCGRKKITEKTKLEGHTHFKTKKENYFQEILYRPLNFSAMSQLILIHRSET